MKKAILVIIASFAFANISFAGDGGKPAYLGYSRAVAFVCQCAKTVPDNLFFTAEQLGVVSMDGCLKAKVKKAGYQVTDGVWHQGSGLKSGTDLDRIDLTLWDLAATITNYPLAQ